MSHRNSQTKENNQAKQKIVSQRDQSQNDVPSRDMIDANDYQTSSQRVSEDMAKSRQKAQDFEKTIDDSQPRHQRSRDK